MFKIPSNSIGRKIMLILIGADAVALHISA
jgi:hypothetical protein